MIKRVLKENLIFIILLIIMILSFSVYFNSNVSTLINNFDSKTSVFFSNFIDTKLTTIFKIITFFGDIYIPIIIIMCTFLLIKNKNYFYILIGSYIFSGAITFASKIVINRARPVDSIIPYPDKFSFPSGHTLTSMVFYFMLCYLLTYKKNKKTKIITYILTMIFIFLIGLSRVYLKVHYFSDVIGGLLIGIITLFIIINFINENIKEKLL